MHGMTNSWGFDFNEHGEVFVINTVIGHLWHAVPGAHVKRMYGTDINPHAYGLIEQTADHVHWDTGEVWNDIRFGVSDKTSAAGGGHAHIGMMIYQGDNWPVEYRNQVYTCNLHGLRLNRDTLVREGAGYVAHHGADLCFIADPWYRGMDLITGPDGGVFIADWSDTGECHDHDGVHRNSGRIYKLIYGTPAKLAPFDLAGYDTAQLLKLQQHSNDWWSRQARRIIQERAAAPATGAALAALQRDVQTALAAEQDPVRRLRLLWTANAAGIAPELNLEQAFQSSPDEHERVWKLRLAVDGFTVDGQQVPAALADSLARLAATEHSGLVQLYMASAMQRLPVPQRWSIAEALCTHSEFAHDRMLPLMIWYGIEPSIPRDRARALKLIATSKVPIVRQYASRRLTEDIESDPDTVNALVALAEQSEPVVARDIVVGMAEALRGWSKAPQPAAWSSAASKLAAVGSAELKQHVQELGVVFGDGRAIDELRAMVADGDADPNARRQALRAMLISRPANMAGSLQDLTADRVMAIEAIRGLALYDDPHTPARVFKNWNLLGPAERAEAINTFCTRPAYARALLDLVREAKIAKTDVSAFHARQIQEFDDPELTKQLADVWGEVRSVDRGETRVNRPLQVGDHARHIDAGSARSGPRAFPEELRNCHVLYGVGRKVGPDLTGSNRKNLDYLLENVIDPSASVGADFRSWVVALDDGRVLNGVITEQTDRTLTLQTAQESITLDRKTIDQMKQTANSLMPDGMLEQLSDQQVRDLVAYLMAVDQVDLPPDAVAAEPSAQK